MSLLVTRSSQQDLLATPEGERPLHRAEPGPVLATEVLRDWIQEFLPYRKVRVLCVGAVAVPFANSLLALGYGRLAVLEPSKEAISRAQPVVGELQWIEREFTQFLPTQPFSLWYDPGLFGSLEASASRMAYGHAVWNSLLPGGLALIATPVDESLSVRTVLGPSFRLRGTRKAKAVRDGRELGMIYSLFERN